MSWIGSASPPAYRLTPFRKETLEFDGARYVIHNLAGVDDTLLDFDYPLEVRNIPPHSEVSTRNARIALLCLQDWGFDVEKLFSEFYPRHPYAFINNPHNWFSFDDLCALLKAVKQITGKWNPRFLLEIGKFSVQHQSAGLGLDMLVKLLSMKRIYQETPKYNRMFNNEEFLQAKQVTANTFVAINKFAQFIVPRLTVDFAYWTMGICMGIPKIKNLPLGKGKIDYSLIPIENLLTTDYAFLKIGSHKTLAREARGFQRRHFLVDDVEYAHEAVFLKETLGNETRRVDGRRRLFRHQAYAPRPHEYEEFSCEQLGELLKRREAVTGMLVTRDLVRGEEAVLQQGEVYSMPYNRFTVHYSESKSLAGMAKSLLRLRSDDGLMQKAMDAEIRASKEEAIRANREAQIAKRNEQLAVRERERAQRTANIFRTYTRSSLVDRVNRGEDPRSDGSKPMSMSVLFSDIRNFTAISESMDAEDVVKFLNSYFDRMNGPIMECNGEIHKLMGDCIMAGFSNLSDPRESARSAVKAAVSLRRELQAYNRERWRFHAKRAVEGSLQSGFLRIDNGVGISFGTLVVGNIGSSDKLDHTLIGDTVNVASRLESLTKHYGIGILVSEEVNECLDGGFETRFVDTVQVKGKSRPVCVYEVFDHEPDWVREKKWGIRVDMEEAFALYSRGHISDAHRLYGELNASMGRHTYRPNTSADPLLDFYSSRCDKMGRHLRAGVINKEKWDGVYVAGDA